MTWLSFGTEPVWFPEDDSAAAETFKTWLNHGNVAPSQSLARMTVDILTSMRSTQAPRPSEC